MLNVGLIIKVLLFKDPVHVLQVVCRTCAVMQDNVIVHEDNTIEIAPVDVTEPINGTIIQKMDSAN